MNAFDIDNDILKSNEDLIDNNLDDLMAGDIKNYARDWTVQTICDQILQGNIDLNPKFQRRNAWNDQKRSRLIESLMLRLPVPEIVLAEHSDTPNTYIVLDGKQRLLTIMGFIYPEENKYWDSPKLQKLEILKNLENKSYNDFENGTLEFKRSFQNASIRCTVIFGYKKDDLLYQIFYRLNSGAEPLSMQELRQALRKGKFSDYLMSTTNEFQPIHRVMGLDGPDKRLVDAEIILKFIAIKMFGTEYSGNLKQFLDEKMNLLNKHWNEYEKVVKMEYELFNKALALLEKLLGLDNIARLAGKNPFNRNILETQAYYFSFLLQTLTEDDILTKKTAFIASYREICANNQDFSKSLNSNTTSTKNYAIRFEAFARLVQQVFGPTSIPANPFDRTQHS